MICHLREIKDRFSSMKSYKVINTAMRGQVIVIVDTGSSELNAMFVIKIYSQESHFRSTVHGINGSGSILVGPATPMPIHTNSALSTCQDIVIRIQYLAL